MHKIGIIIEQHMGDFKEVSKVYHDPFFSGLDSSQNDIIPPILALMKMNFDQYYSVL